MKTHRNLLVTLGEWFEERAANRSEYNSAPLGRPQSRWLPTPGTIIFVVLALAVLLWGQSVGAFTLVDSSANSTGTIAYQGRLADAGGNPLTSTLNMSFRLYNAATGGAPLWTEQWTGSNGVQVSDGLFNVMLGSLTPIPQNVIIGNPTLFLGITVGTDDEMSPRVQLGSVPFAVQALTVPDGSITTDKIADEAITSEKLAEDLSAKPFTPKVLKYVNRQDDLIFDSSPTGEGRIVEELTFTLAEPPPGYRWDLTWNFNQRFGMMHGQSVGTSFLIDGQPIKDSDGQPFAENVSLSVQGFPTDNQIFGGMVYQNNVVAGEHVLTWRTAAWGDPSDKFLVRQRWLMLSAILVPVDF